MISKTLDNMLSQMEQSTDEDRAVAASCLRIDMNRLAENHACYRCEKASWMAAAALQPIAKFGQPTTKKVEFRWRIKLGACGAFLPVTGEESDQTTDCFPDPPFFCSAQKTGEAAGGFAAAAGGGTVAGWGETQTPRQRVPGQGEE